MEKIIVGSRTGISSPSDDNFGTSHLTTEQKQREVECFITDQARLDANQRSREWVRKYKVKHGPTGANPWL